MKIILKEDVKNLGTMGSLVNVADGYARNYLIPRNLAVEADIKNIKQFEHEKKIIIEKAKKVKRATEELANKLSNITLTIEANAGDDGKLFGSVTTMDVAAALSSQGVEIDRRKITIPDEPIKRLGTYTVHVRLHPDVTTSVNMEVRSKE